MDTEELTGRCLAIVAWLRPGEVTTYGEVAAIAGAPRHARAVGRALALHGDEVPWWRVVTASGRLVPGHEAEQADRLAAEGVTVIGRRVVEAPLGRFSREPDRHPPGWFSCGLD